MSEHKQEVSRGIFSHLRLLFAFTIMYTHSVRFIESSNRNEIISLLFGLKKGMGLGLGDLGVSGFFAISGYLICGSWIRNPSLRSYVKNRALRLYPGYMVSSILCLTLFAYLVLPSYSDFIKNMSIGHTLKQLITFGGPSDSIFLGTHHPFANGSTWTIRLEIRMYVLAALIGALTLSRKYITMSWISLFLLSVLVTFIPYIFPKGSFVSELYFKEELFLRFMGCFSAGYLLRYFEPLSPHFKKITLITIPLFLLSLFYTQIIPLTILFFLPVSVIAIGRSKFLQERLPILNNDLSYGVFLYSWPIQKTLIYFFPSMGVFTHLLLATPIALLFALASWKLVEQPAMKYKLNPRAAGTP